MVNWYSGFSPVQQDGSVFCFGSNIDDDSRRKDTCQGDSGGPVQCIIGGHWTIVGVTSWGVECGAKDKPAIYTRLAHPKMYQFIQKYL